MNLTQLALLIARTTGTGVHVSAYFGRAAKTGDTGFASPREATRVAEFCSRIQAKAEGVLGEEGAADLVGEAIELEEQATDYLRALEAATQLDHAAIDARDNRR